MWLMVAQPFCFQDAIGPQLRHECVSYLLPLVNARQVQGHALGNDRSLSNSVKQPGSCRLIESVGQLDGCFRWAWNSYHSTKMSMCVEVAFVNTFINTFSINVVFLYPRGKFRIPYPLWVLQVHQIPEVPKDISAGLRPGMNSALVKSKAELASCCWWKISCTTWDVVDSP